jgi:hypothetical protein
MEPIETLRNKKLLFNRHKVTVQCRIKEKTKQGPMLNSRDNGAVELYISNIQHCGL